MKLFVLALVMYALVIVFTHRKAWIALGAAAIVLVAGAVGLRTAIFELVSWNILAIYVGSLVIADLFIYSRVPAYLADRMVDKSPTLGIAIVAILVMTGLAVMANLQGTATLVGDPPSMIFATYAGYGFNDFFFYAGKLSIFFGVQVGAIAGALYFFGYFHKLKKIHIDLPEEKIVSLVPTVLLLGMIFGLAAVSFLSGKGLHAGSGILCLALAAVGLAWFILVRKEPMEKTRELVKGLDWDTILFLIGACLGGNLTPFGASANVVATGLIKKEDYRVTFLTWIKIGVPFTVLTTTASAIFVYFVWK